MSSSSLSPFIEQIVDKLIQSLQNDTLKKKIQLLVLQPFLQYFLELLFPYIIIVCVVFGLLIILMISIVALLMFKLSGSAPMTQLATVAQAAQLAHTVASVA